MPEIHSDIIAQVILLARETSDQGDATARAALRAFLSGLTEEDGHALVAVAWIGRESYTAEEYNEALAVARQESIAPVETYLGEMPLLAEYLESGLEALGISPTDAEEDLM